MEENLISVPPDFKLYKDRAIYVGTFLGGPLVAGYLIAENFKKLDQPDKARNAWIISIVTTVVIIGAAFLIPNFEKIPRYIIPILYALLAQTLVQKFQGEAIKSHIEKGGAVYSVWRGVWIGLVVGVILIAAIVAIVLLTSNSLTF